MALGKRLINTGGVAACTTDSTDPFGDSSGVALYSLDYDASTAPDGTDYSGTPTDVEFGVGGQINYGARFNGSSSRIVTGVTPATGSGQFSVSGWVNVDSLSAIRGVFSTITNSGTDRKGFTVHVLTSGIVRVLVYDSAGVDIIESTDLITAGNWHHIALTYNNGLTKLYVDGNVQSDTVTQLITGYHDSINIGRYFASVTSNTMLGKIDQVRIFSEALNSTEVGTLFAEAPCVYECTTDDVNYPFSDGTNVEAYYKLDNSSEDYVGGNDGSDTNVEYRFGRFGQAAVFNGSSSKVILPESTTSSIDSNGAFSISFWVFANSGSLGSTQRRMISLFDGIYIWVEIPTNQFLRYRVSDSTPTNIENTGTTTITEDAWHHVVLTGDSTNGIIAYLDGSVEISSASWDGTFRNGTGASQYDYNVIGGQENDLGSLIRPFLGKIDQVRIYSTALTSSQVTELYEEKPCADTSNFKTVLYEGNSSTQYISNVGFSPDLVWIKRRTTTATDHVLMDTIREKYLISNKTNAEASYGSVFDFNHLGFDLNGNSSSFNLSGDDYVAWCWKGGGDDVLNEVGDIDSQVSANTESGFSIVKFTSSATISDTIGHGLFPSAPEMIIYKRTNTTSNWTVYTNIIDGSWDYLRLNKTDAKADSASTWSTSSTIKNVSTAGDWIAYCFHSVAGYSKIGSYSGTGIDGNAIYLDSNGDGTGTGGFQPSFILIKRTDSPDNWNIVDNQRGNNGLFPDVSSQELSNSGAVVFNTNGFTINGGAGGYNNGSGTYLYMAFK